jgi:site-specific DNA-methyltransferase (adenine-specific)
MNNKIFNGDCLDVLKKLDSNTVDLTLTDPPYGYSFMGKDWDKALPNKEIWKECFRVMKPGAFAFVMSAPRSDVQSRMAIDLEDAGFNISFTPIYWVYSSGFPKAYNMGQSAEKLKTIGKARRPDRDLGNITRNRWSGEQDGKLFTDTGGKIELTTDEGKMFQSAYGGFQPKPAVEVVIVAMKPLSKKTFVENALENGKGVTWLDDCRIPDLNDNTDRFMSNLLIQDGHLGDNSKFFDLDVWWSERLKFLPESVASDFPTLFVKKPNIKEKEAGLDSFEKKTAGSYLGNVDENNNNSLGANPSRQPSKRANVHPTIKPIELMNYLTVLGSRENDVVLDPFMGSGTTCISAIINDRNSIGIELQKEYFDICESRIEYWKQKKDMDTKNDDNLNKFFE